MGQRFTCSCSCSYAHAHCIAAAPCPQPKAENTPPLRFPLQILSPLPWRPIRRHLRHLVEFCVSDTAHTVPGLTATGSWLLAGHQVWTQIARQFGFHNNGDLATQTRSIWLCLDDMICRLAARGAHRDQSFNSGWVGHYCLILRYSKSVTRSMGGGRGRGRGRVSTCRCFVSNRCPQLPAECGPVCSVALHSTTAAIPGSQPLLLCLVAWLSHWRAALIHRETSNFPASHY